MGQKVHPIGLRVGVIRDWDSKWYAEKDFAANLHEDFKIREFISKQLKDASVSKVEIERFDKKVNISVHTGKPGMVIGKGGSEIDKLRLELNKLTGKRVHINVVEIKKVDIDAKLVAENIARQLEARVSFRRAQKQAIQRAMRAGAKGIKTQSIRSSWWSRYRSCRTLFRRFSTITYIKSKHRLRSRRSRYYLW